MYHQATHPGEDTPQSSYHLCTGSRRTVSVTGGGEGHTQVEW